MDGDSLPAVKQKPTIHTMNVELSDLPVRAQHHGIDAVKDIVFGSVSNDSIVVCVKLQPS